MVMKMIRTDLITIKFFFLIYLIMGINAFSVAQQPVNLKVGNVSYITGDNIYVKFNSTEGVETGDTLFIQKNEELIPVLTVLQKSSISCLCNKIADTDFKISNKITAIITKKSDEIRTVMDHRESADREIHEEVLTSPEENGKIKDIKLKSEQKISGMLSLSSYSTFVNLPSENNNRQRYTFSLDASDISGSNFSFETYTLLKQKFNKTNSEGAVFDYSLKIYNLALKYQLTESSSIWAGRKINPNIANVGAIDGIQYQHNFRTIFAGVAVGSRPDYRNYGYNFDLLEYGGYLGFNKKTKNGFIKSSLGIFEHLNNFKTDRRFIYLQHTNSIINNLSIFSSLELDLYELENNKARNKLSLTSFYLSSRYTFSRRLSLSASYDNRKNVIYYETFRNYADEIMQRASRQGFRIRINYRPVNPVNFGLTAGHRTENNESKATNTITGTITYSNVPVILSNLSLSANVMETNYLDGTIYGIRLLKNFLRDKMQGVAQYRYVNFNYIKSHALLQQNIIEVDLTYHPNKKWYFSIDCEEILQDREYYTRLYLNLRRNF